MDLSKLQLNGERAASKAASIARLRDFLAVGLLPTYIICNEDESYVQRK